ncbi:MAG: hypothetical protein RLZ10_2267 [Bacteroidota bacterium]|jgi:hypothetical protein
MKFRVVGQSGEHIFPFGDIGPWVQFKENLITPEDLLLTESFGQNIDVLVCHGYSLAALNEAKKSNLSKNRMILVIWEPPINNPRLHSEKYLSNFGHIFVPSKTWAKGREATYFRWPVGPETESRPIQNFSERTNESVMVQSHKFNFRKGENYSLRRRLLFKSLLLESPIILYGHGWNKSFQLEAFKVFGKHLISSPFNINLGSFKYIFDKYPFYLGASQSKQIILENYRFSIVIENHNSYISEKLYDSLNAGCITFYVGPKVEDYGLDKNLVIQIEPNVEEILSTMDKTMTLSFEDLKLIHERQAKLMLTQFENWQNGHVLTLLALNIRNLLR